MTNMSARSKVTQVITSANGVAGTADINGTILDMSAFESVMFICVMGVITAGAVTSIKAQQDTDSAFGDDPQDLLGTAITIAADDDGQIFMIDLVKPLDQFVRVVVDRGTQNAVVASCVAVQYDHRKGPVVQTVTDLVTFERHISPSEGTA